MLKMACKLVKICNYFKILEAVDKLVIIWNLVVFVIIQQNIVAKLHEAIKNYRHPISYKTQAIWL